MRTIEEVVKEIRDNAQYRNGEPTYLFEGYDVEKALHEILEIHKVERPTGEWIKIFENPFTNGYVCPFCGHKIQVTEQFLPKVTECEVCGAKMKKGD